MTKDDLKKSFRILRQLCASQEKLLEQIRELRVQRRDAESRVQDAEFKCFQALKVAQYWESAYTALKKNARDGVW